MSGASKPGLAALIECERRSFDELSTGRFHVEDDGLANAVLRSGRLIVHFGLDQRDGELGTLIKLTEPAVVGESWTWALFLGDCEPIPKARDKQGHVVTSTADQVKEELRLLDRLVREIFSDPERSRDAAYFVKGYQKGYSDRSAGALSGR